jgi:hypothetical protein
MSSTYTPDQLGAELKRRLATVVATVHRGRRKIDDTMMPCGVVVEGDAVPGERRGGRSTEYSLRCECAWHAYVACDPNDPNVAAHAALKAMKTALWSDGTTMAGHVRDVEFLGTDIAPRVDGAAWVLAVLTFSATLVEDVAKPL